MDDKRTAGERDAEREKEKGLLETRGEVASDKARAVSPPHRYDVTCPSADSRQLANHKRLGRPHVLADILAPAHRSAVHDTILVTYAKTCGAMTSCQNDSDCGIWKPIDRIQIGDRVRAPHSIV